MPKSNFSYLKNEFPILFNIGQTAEFNLYQDPVTCLFKLRQFGEKLTELLFEDHHLEFPYDNSFHNRLKTLEFDDVIPIQVKDLLHTIKSKGNVAVHRNKGTTEEAKSMLFSTFKIAKWYYQTYSAEDSDITQVKFHLPEKVDARQALNELEAQYADLQVKFEELLEKRDTSALSQEKEKQIKKRSQKAARKIEMSEADTRNLIDEQLRLAGWEVDTNRLNYKLHKTMPQRGQTLAIAEWPCQSRWADYALFIGTDLYGIVEAKRYASDISTDLGQSKVYAKRVQANHAASLLGKWGEYKVPFLFSTTLRKVKLKSLEKRKLAEGDLLVEISGGGPDQPVGRVIQIDAEALSMASDVPKVGTNFLRLVRLVKGINSTFVYYYLRYIYDSGEVIKYQGGSNNLRNLKFKEYSKIEIPIPPLPEQKRIVAKLDALSGHLDNLKTRLDRIPELLKNLRQQILTQAVTGKLTEEWRKGRGETDIIGEWKHTIRKVVNERQTEYNRRCLLAKQKKQVKPKKPEYLNYEISQIKEYNIPQWYVSPVGLICDSIVPGRDKPKSFTGNIPWITMPSITKDRISMGDSELYLSISEIEEVRAKLIPEGSVVMSIIGRFGIAAILDCKAVINQQLHAYLPSELLLSDFLLYQIKCSEKYLSRISTSTTIAYINKTKANNMPIVLPPLLEQYEIVRQVRELFNVLDKVEATYKILRDRLNSLPQATLSKAFKGELVNQDPSDEPASELLIRYQMIREQ